MPGSKMESLGSLLRFVAALAGKAAETPQLEGSREIFGGMVDRVNNLVQRQAELTADKQDVTQQFQESLVEAQRMATALRAALRARTTVRTRRGWWSSGSSRSAARTGSARSRRLRLRRRSS